MSLSPSSRQTFSAPDADRLNYDKDALVARIHVALAGRAAEELVFGNHTTDTESDLEQAEVAVERVVRRVPGCGGVTRRNWRARPIARRGTARDA